MNDGRVVSNFIIQSLSGKDITVRFYNFFLSFTIFYLVFNVNISKKNLSLLV